MTGDMEDQWQVRQDKNLGVTSLSINNTRVRLCLLHVGIGPHYCVLAKGSRDSPRLRLTDRPGRATGSGYRGLRHEPEACRLPLRVRDPAATSPGGSGAR